jgi:hypothetical protein
MQPEYELHERPQSLHLKTFYGAQESTDSQPGGPVRQLYLTSRPARLHKLAESFPGLHKLLQIRAPASTNVLYSSTFIHIFWGQDEGCITVCI